MEATRDVVYGLVEWNGDFPAPAPRAKVQRKPTPLQQLINEVEGDVARHGKVVILAHYGKGPTASATRTDLTRKYGNTAECKGWTFKIRQVDQSDGSQRVALMASYDPSKVVEGVYEAYIADREAKAAKRRK